MCIGKLRGIAVNNFIIFIAVLFFLRFSTYAVLETFYECTKIYKKIFFLIKSIKKYTQCANEYLNGNDVAPDLI